MNEKALIVIPNFLLKKYCDKRFNVTWKSGSEIQERLNISKNTVKHQTKRFKQNKYGNHTLIRIEFKWIKRMGHIPAQANGDACDISNTFM